MTLEQALNFRMPNGKVLRDMSPADWGQWLEHVQAERALLDTIVARDVTHEQDQRFHAVADRYADMAEALRVIVAARAKPQP